MVDVTIDGWEAGFEKVLFNKLLRDAVGLSLREAKNAVDQLLEGEPVVLTIRDYEAARRLVEDARKLGAIGRISRQHEVKSET